MQLNSLRTRNGAFTLVEIMVVVAIIALLASIAIPGFLRARKRSQGTITKNDLRLIDAAKDQYAIETNQSGMTTVGMPAPLVPTAADLIPYFKPGTRLATAGYGSMAMPTGPGSLLDIFGNPYAINALDSMPTADPATRTALSDVCDATFWDPYN